MEWWQVNVSQEHVEIVRRIYEAVARRDAATVLELYHPRVEFDSTRLPEAHLGGRAQARGHEAVRNLTKAWSEAWESYEDRLEELIDAGDQVISVVTRVGRGRASEVDVSTPRAGLWTIREGRVVEVIWFTSANDARAAAGLPR